MDAFLDILWFKILAALEYAADTADAIIEPLNVLGPAGAILILVLAAVGLTRVLGRLYNTRRYRELENDYHHWLNLRQEAMASEDREKGKAMAKNIDHAKLNKAYYDYFFEGFLKNILSTILPIVLTAAYINRAYAPERLMARFGRPYVFETSNFTTDPVTVSSFFWFVISMLMVFLGLGLFKLIAHRWFHPKRPANP
jgi:sterol desaturase/sphingolipid hydroxylase (fatty acid hydroxylase superfamily)